MHNLGFIFSTGGSKSCVLKHPMLSPKKTEIGSVRRKEQVLHLIGFLTNIHLSVINYPGMI